MQLVSRIRIGVCVIVAVMLIIAMFFAGSLVEEPEQRGPYWYYLWFLLGVLLISLTWWLTSTLTKSLGDTLMGFESGLLNFKDNDFSMSLPVSDDEQLGRIASIYNQVGEVLRQERRSIYQRELLLDKVIQSSPMSMVLTDEKQRVLYSNIAARHLFNQGKRFEGTEFEQLLDDSSSQIATAIKSGRDGLCTIEIDEQEHTYHVSQSTFLLNASTHHLYLFKQLTRELNRQEVSIWKKVIRVISHELNNSLAPISSMAHSGKFLAKDDKKLNLIFDTIEERVTHLNSFIQGYATFSKLPLPQKKSVVWQEFIFRLRQLSEFTLVGELPKAEGFFDPAQIEQVLINLLKNARESESAVEDIEFSVQSHAKVFVITICDRGSGMSEQVLENALLPFYSTKQTGTGLGLPLCREIIEAHEGKMSLHNRQGGGLKVTIYLSV